MEALASWTPESRLLTARSAYPAFQEEAARAGQWRRDGSGGGGRGWTPPKWPDTLSITPTALGGERKELDMCGRGMAGPVRGWPKVTSSGDTEPGFKHALGTSAC